MAKKREYILKEIISTEITYVDRLRFAVEVIIQPLKENNMLDSNDLLAQFSILEKIYQLHMKYSVSELETYPEKFGAFFQNICDNVQTYTDYLLNYESSMQRRCSLLISNRRFSDFLDKAEKDPRMQGQKSESIFILPVQRIPRYRLLLESLLKCTPEEHAQYSVVKNALDKICDMAMYSNEAIRARENKAKIMDIIKTIEPRTRVDLLADPDRVFLKEGPLLRQCRRGLKEFHFWLFNDQLLYGQATPLGLFILNRQIPLNKCFVNPCESMHDGGYCFIVESPAKSFILCLPTEAEKTEWLDAINNAIVALAKARQSKAKQSRQSFAPLWTPDKNSSSCQKCRNAFSLISRRHHCRNCGAIVCDNCSKKRIKLEHVDQHRQVRVCDACFLYLSSPEATKSIRLNSVRLQKGLSGSGTETNTSTDAVEGDELYFSDPDEEDYEEREQLDEDDLNDFNDTMNDEHNQEEYHNMVVSGKSGSTSTYHDRDSDVTLPPTLLQQVGKGLSGVISFANPASRLRNNQDDSHSSSGLPTPTTSEGSPKPPPKPARPSSPTTPSMQYSPGPATPTTPVAATAAPPRRGILKSVSAFVTSGSTFLSNAASAAGGGAGGAADASHPSPQPSPARPVITHAASEKVTVNHDAVPVGGRPKAASFASSGTSSGNSSNNGGIHQDSLSAAAAASAAMEIEQRLSISGTSTDSTFPTRKSEDAAARVSFGADSATSTASSTVEVQQTSAAPEPPVKPPKPPRMARRTNICIKPGDLVNASASVDAEDS